MARFRERISTFIFGLTVGLLIGCAIFIFKLDDYVKNFRFSARENPKFEETTDISEAPVEKKVRKKPVAETKKARHSSPAGSADSSKLQSDSAGGLVMDFSSSSENISVLKEELVGIKNVKVKGLEPQKKDSLAQKAAGVFESPESEFLIVEFWKTPLNSKGYKMTRYKIVLYGLPAQDVDIIKLRDNYYLKNNNLVYRLSYSNEFRKMERVSENDILERIQ